MSIDIRAATPADVPDMLRFVRELAAFEKAGPDDVPVNAARLNDALFGPHAVAEALIAEWDGEAAAFALFFHNFSTWQGLKGLYLEDLYVSEAMRGHGIGSALLKRLAGIAVERGCVRFEWVVLDWNEGAIRVYERIGAKMQHAWRIMRMEGEALKGFAA
ncbi:GNAT family N-acetyltransferase [Novosphingopyxis sp.]|uniref:GNAT family N-acetyltransferase n=1 Tax=Novosphingopyxis sp. TaxID=2709690 RepID=UPI003B58C49F